MSECYYQICRFYREYILDSASVKEASRDDFTELFDMIKSTMNAVDGAGAYDQLTLYNGVFMLIYDQTNDLASVNMDEQTVLSLFDGVYNKAMALNVNKAQAKEKQKEIRDHYEDYREAIERAYDNAAKGR